MPLPQLNKCGMRERDVVLPFLVQQIQKQLPPPQCPFPVLLPFCGRGSFEGELLCRKDKTTIVVWTGIESMCINIRIFDDQSKVLQG